MSGDPIGNVVLLVFAVLVVLSLAGSWEKFKTKQKLDRIPEVPYVPPAVAKFPPDAAYRAGWAECRKAYENALDRKAP